MKRSGNLFGTICSWENLEHAARLTRRHKRYRIYAEDFELRRESHLEAIRAELLAGNWQPKAYRTFTIFDPKERLICAPCYRDRIVHHALCNVIGPVLERAWIDHSYSCRTGKGTGAARERCRQEVAHRRYVLKMDMRRYFPSIDHGILKEKLRRHVKCKRTLALADRIIDSWRDEDAAPVWHPGDDLLDPLNHPRGLPIGALTSQLFANEYLSRIDHWVQEEIRPAAYLRYTDDLLLFSDDKRMLATVREQMIGELSRERLRPHPTKCRVHACREGIPFLGFRFFPDRVRVLRENRMRFERRMAGIRRGLRKGRAAVAPKIWPAMFGWFQFIREYGVNEGLVRAECRHQVFR